MKAALVALQLSLAVFALNPPENQRRIFPLDISGKSFLELKVNSETTSEFIEVSDNNSGNDINLLELTFQLNALVNGAVQSLQGFDDQVSSSVSQLTLYLQAIDNEFNNLVNSANREFQNSASLLVDDLVDAALAFNEQLPAFADEVSKNLQAASQKLVCEAQQQLLAIDNQFQVYINQLAQQTQEFVDYVNSPSTVASFEELLDQLDTLVNEALQNLQGVNAEINESVGKLTLSLQAISNQFDAITDSLSQELVNSANVLVEDLVNNAAAISKELEDFGNEVSQYLIAVSQELSEESQEQLVGINNELQDYIDQLVQQIQGLLA